MEDEGFCSGRGKRWESDDQLFLFAFPPPCAQMMEGGRGRGKVDPFPGSRDRHCLGNTEVVVRDDQ